MMNCKNIAAALVGAILVALTSCSIVSSKNGDLDGAWRLVGVNDAPAPTNRIFWNFQGALLDIADQDRYDDYHFLLRFNHADGKLKLSDPYIYDRDHGDKPLKDTIRLQHIGVMNIDEPFNVLKLDGESMTLQATGIKLEFKQF